MFRALVPRTHKRLLAGGRLRGDGGPSAQAMSFEGGHNDGLIGASMACFRFSTIQFGSGAYRCANRFNGGSRSRAH